MSPWLITVTSSPSILTARLSDVIVPGVDQETVIQVVRREADAVEAAGDLAGVDDAGIVAIDLDGGFAGRDLRSPAVQDSGVLAVDLDSGVFRLDRTAAPGDDPRVVAIDLDGRGIAGRGQLAFDPEGDAIVVDGEGGAPSTTEVSPLFRVKRWPSISLVNGWSLPSGMVTRRGGEYLKNLLTRDLLFGSCWGLGVRGMNASHHVETARL